MKIYLGAVALVIYVLMSGTALSRPVSGRVVKKTFRLHLDTPVLYFNKNLETEEKEEFRLLWTDSPYVYLGVGYATSTNFLLGMRLRFGYTNRSLEEGEDKDYNILWGVLPYLEFTFFPTKSVSPFLTAEMGIEGTGTPEKTNVHFTAGGGAGLHFFLSNRFSLDLTFLVSYHAGRDKLKKSGLEEEGQEGEPDGEEDLPDPTDPANAVGNPNEVATRAISINLMFGLSGWF